MSGSAVRAGRAFVEVFLKDQVSAGLRSLSTRMQSMSGVLGRVGGMGLAAGVGILGGFLAPLRAASDLQEIMSKFDTVFGQNAVAVKGWSDAFAGEVGRSKQQIAEFMASSQDLFVPLGFDEAGATNLSKTITGLAVDLASFNNTTDPDALRDLHAALTGSGEVMKKYGVIVSEAAVKQELLAQGIDATDASEQQKVMARLTIIMRGTTAAQGDAIRTAGSWANQNKRIMGSLTDISSAVGGVLIKVLSPFQTRIGDILSGGSKWIEQNKLLVIGVAATGAALLVAGGGLIGLSAATYASSIALGGLASITRVAGTVLGATSMLVRSLAGGMLFKRVTTLAAAAATRVYAGAIGVARIGLMGMSGALGVVRGGVAAMRLAFVGASGAIGMVSAAAGLARSALFGTYGAVAIVTGAMAAGRSVFAATAIGVRTFGLVMTFTESTSRALTAAWRATAAALGASQAVIGAGVGVIRAGTAAMIGLRAVWTAFAATTVGARVAIGLANVQQLAFAAGSSVLGVARGIWVSITGAVAAARGAMTLANVQQLAFAAGTSVLGAARSIWAGITGVVAAARAGVLLAHLQQLAFAAGTSVLGMARSIWAGITAAVLTARGAMTLANVQQLGFAAGSSVLGVARGIWVSITGAVAAARGAMTLANVQQLGFAAGASAMGVARGIWAGITAAVLTARGAMTLANVQQLAMGAGTAVLAIARGAWSGLAMVVTATGGAMSIVRGVSLTTAGAMAIMTMVANGGAGAMALLSAGLAAVQAAALGPIAPIALVVAAIAGVGTLLYLNRETVFDFLGNSLDGLGPILDGVSAQWSAFAGGISTWFSGVVGEAKIAWDGISAAIAVNDLSAAWSIAWNTMKIVALQTFGPLSLAWNEFTTGMTSMFDGAIVGIRQAWNSASTAIAQVMFDVLGAIQGALDRIAEFDPTGLAERLRGVLDIDTTAIDAMLEADKNSFNAGLDADKQQRDDERGAALSESQAALAKAIADAEADIRKARDAAVEAAKAKQAEQAKTLAEPVAPKADEFNVAKLFESAMASQKDAVKDTDKGGGVSPDISGTFSSASLALFAAGGPSSVAQEQLNTAKEQLKKQDKIVQWTSEMAKNLAAAWTVG